MFLTNRPGARNSSRLGPGALPRRVFAAAGVVQCVYPDDVQVPSGTAGSATVTVSLGGAADEASTVAWCARVHALVAEGHRTIDCDVRELSGCAAAVTGTLARVQLTARRSGGRIRLLGVDDRMRLLLELVGLTNLLAGAEPDRPG
ncbi:STAS domain-containing protein [Nocardia beijingensis]|uniref:STAS domain-containing protein n=1 Tax=Nocardia beijingensis TaxID=95162 RepID=UPI001E495DD6|nr:STAS domain-containing protein [Nocardia beijingensis]